MTVQREGDTRGGPADAAARRLMQCWALFPLLPSAERRGESPFLIAFLKLHLENYITFQALQYHKEVEELKAVQRTIIKMMGGGET